MAGDGRDAFGGNRNVRDLERLERAATAMRTCPISNNAEIHRMKFGVRWLALGAVLCMAIGLARAATTGPASTQPAATAPSSQPAPPLPPIRASEVASRSESVLITIRNLQANVQIESTVQRIDQELSGMTAEIDGRVEETDRILAAHASLQSLRNIQSQWESAGKKLANLRSDLTQSGKQLSKQIAQLSQMDSDWRQTLAWAQEVHASPEIGQAVKVAVNNIERAQANLTTRQHQFWDIIRHVDEQDARVMEYLAAVQQAREQLFSRLLVRDSPPLWSAFSAGRNENAAPWAGTTFARQFSTLSVYIRRHAERVGIHTFVLVVFCAVLLWSKRRLRARAGDDAQLAKAMAVFQHPIATGIVLAFVAGIWIHPDAPQLLWAIVAAAALAPTILIIRRLIDPRLFGILDVLVLVFLLNQIRSLLTGQPLIYRILYLAEIAGVTVYLMVLLWRFSRPADTAAQKSRRWVVVRVATRIAIAFFSLVFLANVLGYCALANFLGDALLASSYLALLVYASTRIVGGLLIFGLRAWPLNLIHAVVRHEGLLLGRIGLLIDWGAAFLWLYIALDLFNIRDTVINFAWQILAATLTIGSISLSLGHLLAFIVTIWAAVYMSRFARFLLEEDVFERLDLPTGIPYAISRMLHYLILVWGFCIAIAALGYDMTKFTILAGAFGVGLGFGMQNIVNNFVSGVILLFERPIKVGDVIQMNDTTGVVEHIGIRASIMRTPEGSEIIVPNGNLLSASVTNWTLSDGHRAIVLPISIAAGPDPNHVMNTLKDAAQSHPNVLPNPPAVAYVTKISADALSIEIRAWTDCSKEWVEVRSDLAVKIYNAAVQQGFTVR